MILKLNEIGSGYRTVRGSLNLKTYSTTSCNVKVMHEGNTVE